MFSDAEFATACEEIDSPYLDGWEYFTQSYSGLINIYRHQNEVGWIGLHPISLCHLTDLQCRVIVEKNFNHN